jgi:hypothetical protein
VWSGGCCCRRLERVVRWMLFGEARAFCTERKISLVSHQVSSSYEGLVHIKL